MVKERGQHKQRQSDDRRGNPCRYRGLASGLFRDRRPGESACGGVALKHGAEKVDQPQRPQFLVGIHVVVVALFQGLGHTDGFHERHKRERQRSGEQVLGVGHTPCGKGKRREALRDRTDHGNVHGLKADKPRCQDARHHHD